MFCHYLVEGFNGTFFKADWPKISWGSRKILFGKEDNIRVVYPFKIGPVLVEGLKEGENSRSHRVPAIVF